MFKSTQNEKTYFMLPNILILFINKLIQIVRLCLIFFKLVQLQDEKKEKHLFEKVI